MTKLIALDADGVLLDYNKAYGRAWERAFGQPLELANPNAYWARDRWGAPWLEGATKERFRQAFNHDFWSSIPAVEGAVAACRTLHSAGFRLVVVSALPTQHRQARLDNLHRLGLPVDDVIATPPQSASSATSPKARALAKLQPQVFVDDYLPYLRGVPRERTHLALITRDPEGSPNQGPEMHLAHSTHANLAEFARWWLFQG